MDGLSQTRMILISVILSDKWRGVGTIFALFKKRMPVNREIGPYQLLKSGGDTFEFFFETKNI
jgi:hypothetical protein